MPGNVKVLIFSMLLMVCQLSGAQQIGALNAPFTDLFGRSGFQNIDKLTICDDSEYIMSSVLVHNEAGIFYGNINLTLHLPTGIELGASRNVKVFSIDRDSIQAYPGIPYTYFATDISSHISLDIASGTSAPVIGIQKQLGANKLFLVQAGISARCNLLPITSPLHYSYTHNYSRFNAVTQEIIGTPITQSFPGNSPLNNIIATPVLLIASQSSPVQISGGQFFTRRVVVRQTGQFAGLGVFTFRETNATAVTYDLSSVQINGKAAEAVSVIAGGLGITFPVPADKYDVNGKFDEGDSIVISYRISATCPFGENQSQLEVSWGCADEDFSCANANTYYNFNISTNGTPVLHSTEQVGIFDCTAGKGSYTYTVSNTGNYVLGNESEAIARNIILRFDTRGCDLVDFNRFEVEYKGMLHIVTPTQIVGSIILFNLGPLLGTGLHPDQDSFFVFRAVYNSKCNNSTNPTCFISCNTTCRKPFIALEYEDKCGKRLSGVFHRATAASDVLGLPCNKPMISLSEWAAPSQCEPGRFLYTMDLSTAGTISNTLLKLENNGCNFYSVSTIAVNGTAYPVITVQGGWQADIPGPLSGQVLLSVEVTLAGGQSSCVYPNLILVKYDYCGASTNTLTYNYSGQGATKRILPAASQGTPTLELIDEKAFAHCEAGYLEYKLTASAGNLLNLGFTINTGTNCNAYVVGDIALNGVLLPASSWSFNGNMATISLADINTFGLADADGDGFRDDLQIGQELILKVFTNAGLAFTSHCSYPTIEVLFHSCGMALDKTTLVFSGKPASAIIQSASGIPRVGLETLSNSNTDWVGYCKQGNFNYSANLTTVGTIYDMKFYLDKRGCELYRITSVLINGYAIPSARIKELNGIVWVDISNINGIPGLVDADGDGFKDDGNGLPVSISFATNLHQLSEGISNCCRQPRLNMTYSLCKSLRDSVSTFINNTQSCLSSVRPATVIKFDGYTSGGYCVPAKFSYSVNRNNVVRLDEMRLSLNSHGCGDYQVYGVQVNGITFPAETGTYEGTVFTLDLNKINQQIPGFIDGIDGDGKTDAYAADEAFKVDFLVTNTNNALNCSYPSLSVSYGICGSQHITDSLTNSGLPGDGLANASIGGRLLNIRLLEYFPVSYCDTGKLTYAIQFSRRDTIGGIKIEFSTRGNTFYNIDAFRINSYKIPEQYVSKIGDKYFIDISKSTYPIPGFFDAKDYDAYTDETDAVFYLSAILSLPCAATSSNGQNVEGINGNCAGPAFQSFWPTLLVSYDKCYENVRYEDTLVFSGYRAEAIMIADANASPGSGFTQYKRFATLNDNEILHRVYYKYMYHGIRPCPNDTQLVFRIEFPDKLNNSDPVDGFEVAFVDKDSVQMAEINTGYIGHKTDTVYDLNGAVEKVVLSIFFNHDAAKAIGPSSTYQEKIISFVASGRASAQACDFVEFLDPKVLTNMSLSFIGKDAMGRTACQYERFCKNTMKVPPVRSIPPCPCPAEWVGQKLERISLGYSDNTMSGPALIPDNLSQGGKCDTFRLSNMLVRLSDSPFDTLYVNFDTDADQQQRALRGLTLMPYVEIKVMGANGMIKNIPVSYFNEHIAGARYRTAVIIGAGSPQNFGFGDTLILNSYWVTNTSNVVIGTIAAQNIASWINYDQRYETTSICPAEKPKSQYLLTNYNHFDVKIVNASQMRDCGVAFSSVMTYNANVPRSDRWPNEFRPNYYLDSIVVLVNGMSLTIGDNSAILSSPGLGAYAISSSEIELLQVGNGTKLIFKNLYNKWPVKKHATFKGEVIYTLDIAALFNGCCYQISGQDSTYSFTYYYTEMPGRCSGFGKSGNAKFNINYSLDHIVKASTNNVQGCAFTAVAAVSNVCTDTAAACYPGFFTPSFKVDSIRLKVNTLVDLAGNITISNKAGESVAISAASAQFKLFRDQVNKATYITLYNTGNWPVMTDAPGQGNDIYLVSAQLNFRECCYVFNNEIDHVEYDFYYTSIQAACVVKQLSGTAEALSIYSDIDFFSRTSSGILNGCRLSVNSGLYSTCDPLGGLCYPEFINPLYRIDSVAFKVNNRVLEGLETAYIQLPGGERFDINIANALMTTDAANTHITFYNNGTWPLMQDTVKGENPGYTVVLTAGLGACCLLLENDAVIESRYYFNSLFAGCREMNTNATIPVAAYTDNHSFTTKDRFMFNAGCGAGIEMAIVNNNRYTYVPEEAGLSMWEVDSVRMNIAGTGIAPSGMILLSAANGATYQLASNEYQVEYVQDGLQLKIWNVAGQWPLVAETLQYLDTLYKIYIGLDFTDCCYTFSSADGEASFDYDIFISDAGTGLCKTDRLKGQLAVNSAGYLGSLSLESSLSASNACKASLDAWVMYNCPGDDCNIISGGISYFVDDLKVTVLGALLNAETYLFIDSMGVLLDSIRPDIVSYTDLDGETASVLEFHNIQQQLSFFSDNNTTVKYNFRIPYSFNGCEEMNRYLHYTMDISYRAGTDNCNPGQLTDSDLVHFNINPFTVITPVSGFRNQISFDGNAEWVFDVEKSSLTNLLWVGMYSNNGGLEDIRLFHVYDVIGNSDSLLSLTTLTDGSKVAGIPGTDRARIRAKASLNNCSEQSVNIYAGTACFALPESIVAQDQNDWACSNVAEINNKVRLDSSVTQSAFILDPTINGLKACDEMVFVYELKNVKSGYTFDHNFSFVVPTNYTVDPESWGYLYPFNKHTDVDINSGQVIVQVLPLYSSVFGRPVTDGVEYTFSIADIDPVLAAQGLPGYTGNQDYLSSIAIHFKINTACDFNDPGFIRAVASAATTCRSYSIQTGTNTSRPMLNGVDITRLNTYTYAISDESLSAVAACGKEEILSVEIANLSAGVAITGEKIVVQLPGIFELSAMSGVDARGFDWDKKEIRILAAGIELMMPLPAGFWSTKILDIPYKKNSTVPGTYPVSVSTFYEAQMTCASINADCDVKIATGEILAVSINYVKKSLLKDTVICLSQAIELTVGEMIFSNGTGKWNLLQSSTSVQIYKTGERSASFYGLQSGTIYGLIYTAFNETGNCSISDTMQLTVLSCGMAYDTVNATSAISICHDTFGRAADDKLTLCSGSVSGSGEFGNWYVKNKCLVYEAGIIPGTDTICVVFCNDKGMACDTLKAIITVLPVISLSDDYLTFCDGNALIHVLSNDIIYGHSGEVQVVEVPFNGLSKVQGNSLLYIPDPDFTAGYDTLYYRVCDRNYPGICDTAMVVVRTGDCNLPPVAVNDYETTMRGQAILVYVLSNDSDPDGDPVRLCNGLASVVQLPANGSINVLADSLVIYTPHEHFTGMDSFRYEICDPAGLKDYAWVYISVVDGIVCEVPNGFSPNGDGINDLFIIPCDAKGARSLRVWNRWGGEVYFSQNYQNNWDGTYKGKLLPGGTYFYSFRYSDDSGRESGSAGYVIIYQ
jgi:gliding motility-associated-like protein